MTWRPLVGSPVECRVCGAQPQRPCVEAGADGVKRPMVGGLIHVDRMLAAVNLPTSPLATLPSEARYLDCPACGERRRHDVVRIDGAVRWWSCSCGHERALDSVATVTGGAS